MWPGCGKDARRWPDSGAEGRGSCPPEVRTTDIHLIPLDPREIQILREMTARQKPVGMRSLIRQANAHKHPSQVCAQWPEEFSHENTAK
jgi:hypothetical protein